MKTQQKRLVPSRPHKPGGLRWFAVIGYHRATRYCGTPVACVIHRPSGHRGRRIRLDPIPF